MSNDRFAAQLETRIFYFYVVDQKPAEVKITMYGTPYTFQRFNEGWRNAASNMMNMSQPLIDSVVAVIYG
ncbi:hypothetical protein GCM10023149_29830 [Mucilaginibacter gynuensis]|uniref:Uncharacterized protein n=1 Tax=Mucilaginibacter gynuensis TaxID=1302236 RepID=A0ABP8GLY0_9SPHI